MSVLTLQCIQKCFYILYGTHSDRHVCLFSVSYQNTKPRICIYFKKNSEMYRQNVVYALTPLSLYVHKNTHTHSVSALFLHVTSKFGGLQWSFKEMRNKNASPEKLTKVLIRGFAVRPTISQSRRVKVTLHGWQFEPAFSCSLHISYIVWIFFIKLELNVYNSETFV